MQNQSKNFGQGKSGQVSSNFELSEEKLNKQINTLSETQ